MKEAGKFVACCLGLWAGLCGSPVAQTAITERLPAAVLAVRAPSERVAGRPGQMRILDRSCASMPAENLRTQIVNTAVQEWGYFGFTTLDYTVATPATGGSRNRRRWSLLDAEDAARVAQSIAGYWAAAPDSGWILRRQNDRWNAAGIATRWRDPWSAAFISWVMCESGLGDQSRFARAVAHHTYIDQAIMARDGKADTAAYTAFDIGEQPVAPGDMLCRGSRPAYRSLAQRRQHLGVGARTHCDIVVKVDEARPAFHVIGGNVRATVGMKVLPARMNEAGHMQPIPYGRRTLFAHLQLQAEPIPMDALALSPTMQALDCNVSMVSSVEAGRAPATGIAHSGGSC